MDATKTVAPGDKTVIPAHAHHDNTILIPLKLEAFKKLFISKVWSLIYWKYACMA